MTVRIPRKRLICLAVITFLCAVSGRGQQPEAKTLFPVEKDGKFGFIDRAGKVVIPLQFDSAHDFQEGLALVTFNKKMMFIDTAGKIMITPQFDIVYNFSEGLAAVNIGQTRIPNIGIIANPGKWGYIDKTGRLALPLKFTHAEDFSEGLAAVTDGDRSGFIDHTGKFLFEVSLDVTLGFREGVAGVLYRGTLAYFDRTGKQISPPLDYGPKNYSFSEGLVPVEIKGKTGFMDRAGKLVIAPQFEDAEDFAEGLAPVKMRSDETTWCPRDGSGSRKGFTMKWGYIDKTGKVVIPAQYESAAPFSEGLAAIDNCDQAFYIDKTGKKIVLGAFQYASSITSGVARVDLITKDALVWGYIDRSGKMIWGPTK